MYFHHLVPFAGRLISGHRKAYSYLPKSVENFVKPDELKQMMIQAGFKNVQAIPLTMGTVHLYFGVK